MTETGLTSNSSMLGYIHSCLHEFGTLLKEVIIVTRDRETGSRQRQFFLIGYNHRRGFSKRLYGDPNECPEGEDLKWQLRHVRWHLKHYAEQLNLYEDVLDDLSGFLLDTTFKCYLGSTRLTEAVSDPNLLNDCIEVCQELVSAVGDSELYQSLHQNVVDVKRKLDKIQKSAVIQSVTSVVDSQSVLDFVQETLLLQIKKENSEFNKPVTKRLLNLIVPQLAKNSDEDSGIVCDLLPQTPSPSTPSPKRVSSTKKSTPASKGPKKMPPSKHESTPISSEILMESSMVIVDSPVLKNKQLEQVKETPTRTRRNNNNYNDKKSGGDSMDGSFVLI